MTLQELYQQIRLQQAIVQRLNDLWPEFEMPEELLAGMMDRETAGQAYRKLDAVLASSSITFTNFARTSFNALSIMIISVLSPT